MKIIGVEKKEEKSGVLVKGIDEVERAIRLYFDEISDIKRPSTRILEETRESLRVKESSVHVFGWDEMAMTNESSIFVRRISPREDIYLIRFNVPDQEPEKYVADAIGAKIALNSIEIAVKIESLAEENKFSIDCKVLAEALKKGPLKDFELIGTQLASMLTRTKDETWTLIYKNDHLRLRMKVWNVAGPWSSDGKTLLWQAEDAIIQGPIEEEFCLKYKREKKIPVIVFEIANSDTYEGIGVPIFGEVLIKDSRKFANMIKAALSTI